LENGLRFAQLFRGHGNRYGRYDLPQNTTPEEKVDGRARTVDKEILPQDYVDHTDGKVGIGVIPLQGAAKEKGTINFAAIDIDVYKREERKQRNLTHEDIALAVFDTPLIVSRSKSDGIHVWLFSKNPVSAALATDYLKSIAAKLGTAGCEVFPKQTERHSEEDVGNWINLPYFGNTRHAVIPRKKGGVYDFPNATLDQFLDVAEAASVEVTNEWLKANTTKATNQRNGEDNGELWLDGPPCLQALIDGHAKKIPGIEKRYREGTITEEQYKKQLAFTEPQLGSGARNNCFFNVGIYLRRRMSPQDPDATLTPAMVSELEHALDQAHGDWRAKTGDKGIGKEIKTLAAQAAKGKWGYKCSEEPLAGHCNRALCLKRKYGVGTGVQDQAFAITGFTIVKGSEKQYYMNVGDARVHVPDVDTLLSQARFGAIVTNATDRVWKNMADPKFKEYIDHLLQTGDKIEGMPDSDRRSILLNALHEFIHSKKIDAGKSDASFYTGRVLWYDTGEARFKLDFFMEFLRSRGVMMPQNVVALTMRNEFAVTARNTHIAGKQYRPYTVMIDHLNALMEGPEDGEA